jgi:hypothetical protein
MTCPHPAKGRKGLCAGRLRWSRSYLGWETYTCDTCHQTSQRRSDHVQNKLYKRK